MENLSSLIFKFYFKSFLSNKKNSKFNVFKRTKEKIKKSQDQ